MILSPSHILVTDSTSVDFNCSVLGSPVGRVVWKRNGKTIITNNRFKVVNDRSLHTLRIKQPKREDKGMIVSKDIFI